MDRSYADLKELAQTIASNADNNTLLIYAGNSVGKTTLSRHIQTAKDINCICFNTFVEETLIWKNDFENDNFTLTIGPYDPLIKDAIVKQGLEPRINDIFHALVGARIDANFEIENNQVSYITFSLATGDDSRAENIKLSKSEESIFAWSIFYALSEMILEEKANGNPDYSDLNYIIIDDPVTSLGEERIVAIALDIRNVILNKVSEIRSGGESFGVLITTHSRLLYNILFSEIGKDKNCFRLSNDNNTYALTLQNESPFGYHLDALKTIKNTLDDDGEIKKIHFNMFRSVLEKTAVFLGCSKWSDCLSRDLSGRKELIKLLNFYSHDRLMELDDKKVDDHGTELFVAFFNKFLGDYKWGI